MLPTEFSLKQIWWNSHLVHNQNVVLCLNNDKTKFCNNHRFTKYNLEKHWNYLEGIGNS